MLLIGEKDNSRREASVESPSNTQKSGSRLSVVRSRV